MAETPGVPARVPLSDIKYVDEHGKSPKELPLIDRKTRKIAIIAFAVLGGLMIITPVAMAFGNKLLNIFPSMLNLIPGVHLGMVPNFSWVQSMTRVGILIGAMVGGGLVLSATGLVWGGGFRNSKEFNAEIEAIEKEQEEQKKKAEAEEEAKKNQI